MKVSIQVDGREVASVSLDAPQRPHLGFLLARGVLHDWQVISGAVPWLDEIWQQFEAEPISFALSTGQSRAIQLEVRWSRGGYQFRVMEGDPPGAVHDAPAERPR